MDKQLALKINNSFTKPMVDLLIEYADTQIERHKSYLVGAETIEEVRKYQGFIAGMNALKRIKEDAFNVLKDK